MLVHDGHMSARRFFTSANADSYDTIASLATFGQDTAWKREIVKAVGRRNSVLELACGTGVLSSMLAKYVDIKRVVDECWRVLRPGGVIVFHDFTYPSGLVRNLWNAHFAILRLAGRFVTSWRMVFEQLDNLIKKSDWVDQTSLALHSRGFRNIDERWYTAGTAAIVSAEKP